VLKFGNPPSKNNFNAYRWGLLFSYVCWGGWQFLEGGPWCSRSEGAALPLSDAARMFSLQMFSADRMFSLQVFSVLTCGSAEDGLLTRSVDLPPAHGYLV